MDERQARAARRAERCRIVAQSAETFREIARLCEAGNAAALNIALVGVQQRAPEVAACLAGLEMLEGDMESVEVGLNMVACARRQVRQNNVRKLQPISIAAFKVTVRGGGCA